MGRHSEAIALHRMTHAVRIAQFGPEHHLTMGSATALAEALFECGEGETHDEARTLAEQTLATQRRVLGPSHPDTLHSAGLIGQTFLETDADPRGAVESLREVAAAMSDLYGPHHVRTMTATHNLAVVLCSCLKDGYGPDNEEGIAMLRDEVEHYQKAQGLRGEQTLLASKLLQDAINNRPTLRFAVGARVEAFTELLERPMFAAGTVVAVWEDGVPYDIEMDFGDVVTCPVDLDTHVRHLDEDAPATRRALRFKVGDRVQAKCEEETGSDDGFRDGAILARWGTMLFGEPVGMRWPYTIKLDCDPTKDEMSGMFDAIAARPGDHDLIVRAYADAYADEYVDSVVGAPADSDSFVRALVVGVSVDNTTKSVPDEALCPICQDKPDDAQASQAGQLQQNGTQCHECGQGFCGDCARQMYQRECDEFVCPMCRTDLTVTWEQRFAGYTRLAASSQLPTRTRLMAQFQVGLLIQFGVSGNPPNAEEAVGWYRKSADCGYAAAQTALGNMLRDGCGVPRDAQEAARYFLLAADQGHPQAQCNLGARYRSGDGVAQSFDLALHWFRKSVAQGDNCGMIQLGFMYDHGEGPLEENAAEAVRLYTLSAKLGNPEAQTNLGILHMNGHSVTRDLNLAARWFQQAAEQGHEKAIMMWANLFRAGKRVQLVGLTSSAYNGKTGTVTETVPAVETAAKLTAQSGTVGRAVIRLYRGKKISVRWNNLLFAEAPEPSMDDALVKILSNPCADPDCECCQHGIDPDRDLAAEAAVLRRDGVRRAEDAAASEFAVDPSTRRQPQTPH